MGIKERLVLSFWSLLAFIVFFSSLKEQVVVNQKLKEQVNLIFPEGWGFFTKNPRDPLVEVFKIDNGKLKPISMANQTLSNVFGLSRRSRVIGYEASMIANKVRKDQWQTDVTNPINHYVGDTTVSVAGIPGFVHFTEGDYMFRLYKPVPYAWAKMDQEQFNPYTVAKIRITPYDKEDSTE